jgi:hypothetical protein
VRSPATAPTRSRIDAAIRDLSEIRSPDPAAVEALSAIALTMITLELFWLRTPTPPPPTVG